MPDAIDVDAKLTATMAAQYADVSPQAIINWRKRGYCLPGTRTKVYLPVAGYDDRGHPLYRLLDVAKAHAATRQRARRI